MASIEAIESSNDSLQVFKDFLSTHHERDILEMLSEDDDTIHYAIRVDGSVLLNSNIMIFTQLMNSPLDLLPLFDQALFATQREIMQIYESQLSVTFKPYCHVRISKLIPVSELERAQLPQCKDINKFLQVTGTVIRCTIAKLLEVEKQYVCGKCGFTFDVQAEFEQGYKIPKPLSCLSPEKCNSTKFMPLNDGVTEPSRCKDYQELKIQEHVQKLDVGNIPQSIWVVLEDDLVDSCKPGDDVTVNGVILRRWKYLNLSSKCDVELVIKANDVVITNAQRASVSVTSQYKSEFTEFWSDYRYSPLEGRNKILASFCPEIFGLYIVKLAVALALIGGVQQKKESGTRIRGESHLLLVGDPGTGKSQFLNYATKLMPRSVLTTGIGSTTAGLTVTAVKDGGEWQLEAGALVLADGGICCIDEFNSIREHDRTSIHEAMEQQTISVAKAGMVCKLNTRTTILAATNPKGKYDRGASLSVNVALASPLLSRFDIVLVMLDNRNEDWDRVITSFILRKTRQFTNKSTLWALERMQAYFCHVKTRVPRLTPDCMKVLQNYYQSQRAADSRNAARTTIRLLESMIRISEAHARLMFRDFVTVQDAVVAITIMESSMHSSALLNKDEGCLHTSFPSDPDDEYIKQAITILTKLRLEDILKKVLSEEEERKNNFAKAENNDGSIVENTKKTTECEESGGGNNAHSMNSVDFLFTDGTKEDHSFDIQLEGSQPQINRSGCQIDLTPPCYVKKMNQEVSEDLDIFAESPESIPDTVPVVPVVPVVPIEDTNSQQCDIMSVFGLDNEEEGIRRSSIGSSKHTKKDNMRKKVSNSWGAIQTPPQTFSCGEELDDFDMDDLDDTLHLNENKVPFHNKRGVDVLSDFPPSVQPVKKKSTTLDE